LINFAVIVTATNSIWLVVIPRARLANSARTAKILVSKFGFAPLTSIDAKQIHFVAQSGVELANSEFPTEGLSRS
jgi:hypothetical protein